MNQEAQGGMKSGPDASSIADFCASRSSRAAAFAAAAALAVVSWDGAGSAILCGGARTDP